ncbi:LpqN/LpqT family lipoprotein [Mycobacterium sp. DL592]|uniref:LpqN/LpqT family lipoprotein n=1 Tax=Mycobacterium sp. DL592 TaxID=2675524 RepID=UPI0014235D7B|nr:LpqN/LpqT family lipoprotein [Mycobacterium sp. DL592]
MQISHRPVIAVVTAVCLSASLAACGGNDKDKSSTTSSSTSSSSSSPSSSIKAAATPKLQPRKLEDSGASTANPTIADYIREQNITETPIHHDDPGAPKVDIQLPDGWQSAGDDTPDYAYGAIVYGAGAGQGSGYPPNIVALLSKLDGAADPDKLLQLAGGEMKNLPGFVPAGEESATVSGYPAYRIAGKYDLNGIKAASGQETVVFKGNDGLYVLQMNATSDESQSQALFDALQSIDQSITITP